MAGPLRYRSEHSACHLIRRLCRSRRRFMMTYWREPRAISPEAENVRLALDDYKRIEQRLKSLAASETCITNRIVPSISIVISAAASYLIMGIFHNNIICH